MIERDWNWWAYLWRVTHRQKIKGIQEWDEKLVRFVREITGVKPEEKLLDLGCGSGEHTRLLSKEGIECTGVEIAESLVRYAKEKAKEERVKVNYINMDMRNIEFKNEFDCVMLVSGTFGYLSDKENFALLKQIHKALKPKGRLFLDIPNGYSFCKKGGRAWQELEGGYLLSSTSFDPNTARLIELEQTFYIDKQGNINIPDAKCREHYTLRIYTPSEIRDMLLEVGFVSIQMYGGISISLEELKSDSSHIDIIAKKGGN